jgi:hypothetical protein
VIAGLEQRWREPTREMLLPISPLLLRALGVRVRFDDRRVALLRDALLEADPLADSVVAWMQETPNARALFDRAVERGIAAVPDAPAPLARLFDEVEHVPRWLDRRAVRLGAETLLRVGRGGGYALGGVSLMSGYLSAGAVKPLVATGALTKMARRRLAETAKFIRDLATSEDLAKSSAGFQSCVRVRVLHAHVRASLQSDGRWNAAAWGAPINQRDMVGTHLEFTVAFIGGLTALGYVLTRREREALMHLWRYVGHVIGVRADLVPTTFKEGLELAYIFNATEVGPDDDGRELARALVDAWEEGATFEGTLGRLEGRFLRGFARFCLGRRAADALALPDDAWKWAPLFVAPARGALEVMRMIAPGGNRVAVRLGRAAIEANVARVLGDARPAFAR